ncbi:hypothetical protein AALP_AA2G146000 [Arabis alpina]|uniref:RRM domain-containing protein n=1 Tax=Arabis alpina TaxID=50452 RepID=A0A087HHG5_ARAAL|nr:hypothetical protein AALP_AA2G146000 [Arabis alpina]
MALKEGKREPEDDLETKRKKQKKDEIETLISDNAKNESSSSDEEPGTSAKPAAKDSSSSEDEPSSSDDDEEPAKTAATDSSSSEDESEDDSKDVQAESSISFVCSKNHLEVRTKRGKRTAYTPQSGIGGNDDQTIIVKGFDSSLHEGDIKSELNKYFSLCGEITSVVVPTDTETGAVIGCAYIELKEGVEKALKLNGSYLKGWKLVVEKVSRISDLGGRSGRGGHWPYPYPSGPSGRGGRGGPWRHPYRCHGLGFCGFC